MDFKTAYLQAIKCEGFLADSAQTQTVEHLDTLYKNLLDNKTNPGVILRAWSKISGRQSADDQLRGCYLWGDVGRGKTWLMDLFYQSLPFKDKSRLHFHEFMQQIHLRLKEINGQRDPLVTVAEDIVQNNRFICLDEFHVSDITDAMLLHGLLDSLYKKGAVLMMTSNTQPDELYKNGLQRSRFIPAIELIKKRNLLLHVNGDQDYRLSNVDESQNYLAPLSPNTDLLLENKFTKLARGKIIHDSPVIINKRVMNHKMMASNIIWFEFEELCGGPRAASDYLYLANNFDYVVVSNVFRMEESNDDMAKRFINLVDAFYDRQVGLIVSATATPMDLYNGNRFKKEFKRTTSRLEEIRAKIYTQSDRDLLKERNSLLSS